MSTPPDWQVVLPVKHASEAKSRLVPPAGVGRADLARAMAQDTLTAVCATVLPARVLVVTSDEAAAAGAQALGSRVLPDPAAGLNEAIAAGLRRCAQSGTAVAVLLGDLPALRPRDLRIALEACARHTRAVVPDHHGSGTVLLTSTSPALRPAFGAGSAARHAQTAQTLDLSLPHLRHDVDDAADLAAARFLGVGPATRSVLSAPQRACAT